MASKDVNRDRTYFTTNEVGLIAGLSQNQVIKVIQMLRIAHRRERSGRIKLHRREVERYFIPDNRKKS